MKLIAIFGMFAAITVYVAFGATMLWNWFVVPMFAAPVMTVPFAVGLMSLKALFSGVKETKEEIGELFFKAAIYVTLFICVGFVARQFV